MIRWIYENIDHITVPFGVLLALLSSITVMIDQRRKRAGRGGVGRAYRFAFIIILVIACLFGGMVLVHTFA